MEFAVKRWLLCLPLLAGCAAEPVIRTVEVEIPVAVDCPAPPAIARPALPLADITADSSPADVLRAYAATVEALMGYSQELEIVLESYHEANSD